MCQTAKRNPLSTHRKEELAEQVIGFGVGALQLGGPPANEKKEKKRRPEQQCTPVHADITTSAYIISPAASPNCPKNVNALARAMRSSAELVTT